MVADSGPLIASSMIGQLDLLAGLYSQVIVPRAVYDEVVVRGAGLPGSAELANATWVQVRGEVREDALFRGLVETLDAGEAAALALAVQVSADLVLLDDLRGRKTARRLGLKVRGSLGVLVEAKRAGLIGSVAPLLDALAMQGIWFSDEVRRRALSEAGE